MIPCRLIIISKYIVKGKIGSNVGQPRLRAGDTRVSHIPTWFSFSTHVHTPIFVGSPPESVLESVNLGVKLAVSNP